MISAANCGRFQTSPKWAREGLKKTMKWTKFSVSTRTEAVDLISDLFAEIGIEGIEIEDNVPLSEADTKGMFIDILPELPPDNGDARVNFYLDDTYDEEETLKLVR